MKNYVTQTRLLPSIVRLVLGIFLVLSPWIWGFTDDRVSAGSAILSGTILVRLGLSGIIHRRSWIVPFSTSVAAWMLLGPWVLRFSSEGAAAVLHWIAGVLTLGLAAGEISFPRSLAKRVRLVSANWHRERRSCLHHTS
jgi:hypothetical protein